jgi:hypothetical protein
MVDDDTGGEETQPDRRRSSVETGSRPIIPPRREQKAYNCHRVRRR